MVLWGYDMKSKMIRVLVAIWLSFMVATVGPALFPDLAVVTTPITCPGGKINVQVDTYRPAPGETVSTMTPLCTMPNGQTKEIPIPASLLTIWGLALLP